MSSLEGLIAKCDECKLDFNPIKYYQHRKSREHIQGKGGVFVEKSDDNIKCASEYSNMVYHKFRVDCICGGVYSKYNEKIHKRSKKHIEAIGGIFVQNKSNCTVCNKKVTSIYHHQQNCKGVSSASDE